jgi:hypothetical protein
LSEADPKPEASGQRYLESFKESPISHSLFWASLVFSLGGFVYNNLQNPNQLFTSAWFYDSFLLSWTNLLVVPAFMVTIYWGVTKKDWSDLKEIGSWFFWSPFAWIASAIAFRTIYKILLLIIELIANFFTWLQN